MRKKTEGFQREECEHFNKLSAKTGETWWGSSTPAGIERLKRRAAFILDRLGAYTEPSVLDLGCGTGALSKYLLESPSPLRLTGCDISPNVIRIAADRYQRYQNAKFEVADVTALPYAESVFDAVVGNSVLHHLPVERSLRKCFRVVKPGGIIVFFEPNMMNPWIALEKNIRFIGKFLQDSEDETAFFRWPLAHVLRATGFERVEVAPFDFLHPLTPRPLIGLIKSLGEVAEHTPLVREFSGSLRIVAFKPSVAIPHC